MQLKVRYSVRVTYHQRFYSPAVNLLMKLAPQYSGHMYNLVHSADNKTLMQNKNIKTSVFKYKSRPAVSASKFISHQLLSASSLGAFLSESALLSSLYNAQEKSSVPSLCCAKGKQARVRKRVFT